MVKKIILLLILITGMFTRADAQYADMGNGVIRNHIWWFNWNGFSLFNGASRSFTTADGLDVVIAFSQVNGLRPAPKVMNTWSGAVLHYLYDFSDPNMMPALYTMNNGQSCYFTMTITATRNGQPAPFTFLAADAEGSLSPVENTTFISSGGNWSYLDFFRNSSQTGNPVTGCGTQTITITDTQGSMDGSPVGQNPLMATVAPSSGVLTVDVKMETTVPGGMGVAFGIYAPLDRGDLPASYGAARHLLKYTRGNGCNFNPPFPPATQDASLILGHVVADADPFDNVDDNFNGFDEEAISAFPDYTGNGSYTLQVPLSNTTGANAWLTGSFDYNRNGVFDMDESVTVMVPANATNATLNWTGLPAVFPAGNGELFAFRLRLASNLPATQSTAITATDGEAEDYMTRINAPCAANTNAATTAICIGSSVQLQASGGVMYSWSPATGLSDVSIANPVASPTVTTDYEVLVADAGGCGAKSTVRVVVNDLVDVNTRTDTTVCAGTPVQLTTISTNGTTFSWAPATGLSNANTLSPVATPATTTRYIVTADNGTGCISKDSVLITIYQPSPKTVTPTDSTICAGAPLTLQATGGEVYEWLENGVLLPETGSSITVSPGQTSSYTVNIISTSCSTNDSYVVPVTVNNLADVSTRSDTVICTGASVQLTTTSVDGTTFSWSPATGLSNVNVLSPVATPMITTRYVVTADNGSGCISQDSVLITVNQRLTGSVTPADSTICAGAPVTLQATGGDLYEWLENGVMLPQTGDQITVSPIQNSTYTVNVINNVCSTSESFVVPITVNNVADVDTRLDTTICAGASVRLLTRSVNGITFSWTPATGLNNANILSPVATPAVTTRYVVTADNGSGCISQDSVLITVNQRLPTSVTPADTAICAGASVLLQATGGERYEWLENGIVLPQTGSSITVSPAQNTTYTVNVINSTCGTNDSYVIPLTVNDITDVSTIADTVVCNGTPVQLLSSSVNGTIFSWVPATGLSDANALSPVATPATTTRYTVTADNGSGCTTQATVLLTINDRIPSSVTPADTAICAGAYVVLQASGGETYEWLENGIALPQTGSAITISPAQGSTYTVNIINNTCGTNESYVIPVIVNTIADVVTIPDTAVCNGTPVQLVSSSVNGTTFSWVPAIGLSNANALSPVATPAATTRYTVTADNGTGCTSEATVLLTINQRLPTYVTPGDTTICVGASLTLAASGGEAYEWLEDGVPLSETGSSLVVTPDQGTIYSVNILNNACGINENFVIPVTVNELPVTAVTSTNEIDCSRPSAMLLATGGIKYVWDNAGGISNTQIANPMVSPAATTTYYVTITDENNCTARDSVTVLADYTVGLSVYPLPSAFSPNGDGKNDCFGLKYWGAIQTLDFRVYDRWGVLVFSAQQAGACWDGTFKGALQPVGSYVYVIRAKTACGEVERKGVVTLVQ
ncbi:T9SS type B sorting domain-containing protein [Chitinophaga agri]|uniref:Gliding motility-associated C-terminal domain-containing protein n=1 Tax=Chitinophaga agri TaxID=2703787 RepID=A0A6B9ZIH4_9BACT|nr:gliding motility-associated C-terminal domain-containing protein [Chitinophaga agri]QHS62188.1 gliding motility-associated C-terminal domain-containing protein [Chitinophaga agri]